MKFAMITFAAAVGSANAWSAAMEADCSTQEWCNYCMGDCNRDASIMSAGAGCGIVAGQWDENHMLIRGRPDSYQDTINAAERMRKGCIDKCARTVTRRTLATANSALETANARLATANAALATATTCMAATPGYSPVNFEDNCDMKQCDQWTCETWCTCYSDDDAAIYTRLGCDTVDDAPCQC